MFLQMLTTLPLQYNDLMHNTMPSQDSHHTIDIIIIIAIRHAVVG